MKEISNLKFFFLISIFARLFFFVFSSNTVLADSAAYVGCEGGKTLYVYPADHTVGTDWLISGKSVNVQFHTGGGVVNDEVAMKIGNSSWVSATPISATNYGAFVNVGNERCGYEWVNVRWRDASDQQLHYCSLKMPKFDPGLLREGFMNSGCLNSCSLVDSNARRAILYDYDYDNWVSSFSKGSYICSNFKLFFNESSTVFQDSGSNCVASMSNQEKTINGQVNVYVSPVPATSGGGRGDIQLYNYINETTCGGPETPTPTPTPVCDPSCGRGVCGMRYWNNNCVAVYNDDFGCCHQTCVPPVGGLCQWVVGAGGFGCNACMPTSTPTPIPTGICNSFSSVFTFSYSTTVNHWWQTVDGDVHAQNSITSRIPGCASTGKYLSLKGLGGMPGVVSWNGTTYLGEGSFSEAPDYNWQAKTDNTSTHIGYDYLFNKLNLSLSPTSGGESRNMPDSGIYLWDNTDSPLTLHGAVIRDGESVIIFSTGDIKIGSSDIEVKKGGFFALISKGNISFGVNIKKAQGFYLADGTITVNKKPAENDNQFFGEGSFIGLKGVILPRNIKDNCSPAQVFTFRPDLYINAPAEFQYGLSFFQEVAP